MDYHNIFARKQLLEVSKELHAEIETYKEEHEEFDEWDLEFRRGIRDGLDIAINKIYERIEKLQEDKK